MTPTDLRMIGECLYGELWQSQLARALGVNDRSVRRWATGAVSADAHLPALLGLLSERRVAIDEAISHLSIPKAS